MHHHQVVPADKKLSSVSSAHPQNPEDLLRLLVKQLFSANLARTEMSDGPQETDEIVLDVELDGHRYILVRSMRSAQSPIELSPREKEIARMVAKGHPNKIIAAVLNISSWTVCTHLRRVFAKLGVSSRAAMVARLHELEPFRAGKAPSNPAAGCFTNSPAISQAGGPDVSAKSAVVARSRRQTA